MIWSFLALLAKILMIFKVTQKLIKKQLESLKRLWKCVTSAQLVLTHFVLFHLSTPTLSSLKKLQTSTLWATKLVSKPNFLKTHSATKLAE